MTADRAQEIWDQLGRRSKLALAVRDQRYMHALFKNDDGEWLVDAAVVQALLARCDKYATEAK
jgi:hypothetical protein